MAEVELPMTLRPAAGNLTKLGDIMDTAEKQDTVGLSDEAFEKMKALAQQGHTKSQFNLGQHYFMKEQYQLAMTWFRKAHLMGEMQAVFQLSVMYYDGIGVLPNLTKGVELLKEVVNNTDPVYQYLVPHAQYNLGMAAFMGYGMQQDDDVAEHYWLLAGKEGDPDGSVAAQSQLGMYYTRRDSKDVKKSFYWHYFAADNGSLESKGALGVMYYLGVGCTRDKELAFKCLCEASEGGSLFAQGNLVVYYYESRLFTRAAHCAWSIAQTESVEESAANSGCLLEYTKRGVALGCFYYGRCLQTGRGVNKNENEALVYYRKAIQVCETTAAELRQKLKNEEL